MEREKVSIATQTLRPGGIFIKWKEHELWSQTSMCSSDCITWDKLLNAFVSRFSPL